MTVLVTGAAGFLGAECVRQLQQAGHSVVTTDKHGVVDHVVELADDGAVARLPSVDAVVHCAAVQYVSDDLPLLFRRAYFARNNVAATSHLVRRYTGTGAHFVNVGSSMMYEQSGRAVYGVDAPMRPQGLYTASKIAAQRLVEAMPNRTSLVVPCIIAGQGRGGLFESLVRTMTTRGLAICPGKGAHKVHLVHVADAAALIVAVVNQAAVGRFNAASPEPLSIVEWIREIAAELRLPTLKILHLPLAPIAAASAATAYRLLAREQVLMLRQPHVLSVAEGLALGWTPTHTNAAIVRETARTIANRL